MRAQGIKPDIFGYLWIEVAEREYTYLSVCGQYTAYSKVFESMFWRVLWKCGISEPKSFATDDDLAAMMKGYADMQMRPGARECIDKLRAADFTVWGFTMDNWEKVRGYFTRSDIEMPADNLVACDAAGVAKPDLQAYRYMQTKLPIDRSQAWFAAAHEWDVTAARRAG